MSNSQLTTPGEISGWPMLKIAYRTDADKIAELLPPGIELGAEPNVNLTIYNFPVPDEPELGILVSVNAKYQGVEGEYTLGYGIDQESAIFLSQNQNGQPKYPCQIKYYRLDNTITAKCTHQGYTFLEFKGEVTGDITDKDEVIEVNEWWIKVSRAVGVMPVDDYDFPPHVVKVKSTYGTEYREGLKGDVVLHPSPWDPLYDLLPLREQLSASLWTPTFLGREMDLAGKLDPQGFLPFFDVIGGSRWPGTFGGPKRTF